MPDIQKGSPHIILGLDYGVKKMGVALGNTLTFDARPLDIVSMDNGQPDWEKLLTLLITWQVTIVVIGLPLNMDNSQSHLSKRASKFARRVAHKLMEQKSTIKVYLQDERLSSHEARSIAWEQGLITHPHDPIDDISACLILTSYLHDNSSITDVTAYQAPQL